MIPMRGYDRIEVPVTIDGTGKSHATGASRLLWTFLLFLVWLVVSITTLVGAEGGGKWFVPFIGAFIGVMIFRYVIIKERFYQARRRILVENDYLLEHSVFWNIYEIEDYRHLCHFSNGMIGLFVAFDKDVIVGKGEDEDYDHYEAIAAAEQLAVERKIEMMHVDYMDKVGKDKRMQGLFDSAEYITNRELREVILSIYNNLEFKMNRAYASYDVYVFYGRGREETFLDNVEGVLEAFKKANFLRYRVLDEQAIGDLTESILNFDNFSVAAACDNLFRANNQFEMIRPLWVERGGERKELNKTMKEIAAIKERSQAEKKARRKFGKFRKNKEGVGLDLEESEQDENEGSKGQNHNRSHNLEREPEIPAFLIEDDDGEGEGDLVIIMGDEPEPKKGV